MKRLGFLSAAAMALSTGLLGGMRAFDTEFPAFGGQAPAYHAATVARRDGLGRRVKPKKHPRHNAGRTSVTSSFADFRRRVEATHSDRIDPRDDKYLHSHARRMRALQRVFAARAA